MRPHDSSVSWKGNPMRKPATLLPAPLAILALSLTFAFHAHGQTLNVLRNWGVTGGDGNIPYSSLIMDSSGNLYGTTLEGGTHNFGTVYRLTPTSSGGWHETVLYSFTGAADGASPHSPLLRDGVGNLYGTTIKGGLNSKNCNSTAQGTGCGVVFKLTPTAQAPWTETVLYSFTGGLDGGNPYAGLVRDKAGNLYGTAVVGGSDDHGTVYRLTSTANGWQQTVLHSFAGKSDGNAPYAPVVFDPHGNLYGTTYEGGAAGQGIVYRLLPQQSGLWTEKILHTFQGQSGSDGAQTFAGVVLDKNGNVFGTTFGGGSFNYGTVFELIAANGFASTLLHSFNLDGKDGTLPNGVIFDASGNLWGTTEGAGENDGNGTIFKLTPGAGGWTETVLFTFQGSVNGTYPNDSLLMDVSGNLYGTTIWGGTLGPTNGGVTFQFIP
jgi:uncharacterized repeat protein (TIGR03803 family)